MFAKGGDVASLPGPLLRVGTELVEWLLREISQGGDSLLSVTLRRVERTGSIQ